MDKLAFKKIRLKKSCFILFYLIAFMIIPMFKSIRYLYPFNLISQDILLVTDEGIIIYNIDTNTPTFIETDNYIEIDDTKMIYINFDQYPSNVEGYIFCRVDKYIYVISNIDYSLKYTIINDDIHEKVISITSYKSKNNIFYCITNYVNGDRNMLIKSYKINDNSEFSVEPQEKTQVYYEDNSEIKIDAGIICKLMNSKDYNNNLLLCFAVDNDLSVVVALAFDPENNMNFLYSNKDINQNDGGAFYIKSVINQNKNLCLICYYVLMSPFRCLIYNSEKQIFSNTIILKDAYMNNFHNFNTYYINNKDEYWIFLSSGITAYKSFLFDNQFQIKNYNHNNEKCYLNYDFADKFECSGTCSISSYLVYNKNKFYFFLSFYKEGYANFTIYEVNEECNYLFESDDFNISAFGPIATPNSDSNAPSSYLDSTSLISSTYIGILHNIEFNNEKDIYIGTINKPKEEIGENLDIIMEEIELNKKYLIYGDNYNITVSPLKEIQSFQSTYVDLSLCEDILREKHNLPHDEILTILQIEIDKMNEKSITNQLEYSIYNQKKDKLNLSYCNNIDITVYYNIKNNSMINKSMILYYSDLGIDILNINDSFFNDICYPFSNSKSDIILKDRIEDIYQNYSICDNNCKYDNINLELNSVACTCQIKTEINTEIDPPAFESIISDIFLSSNFGVLKCYKLIFSSKYKLNNIGFWIFLVFVIAHIPLYIIYFIFGIKSIIIFNNENIIKIFDVIKTIKNEKENNIINNKINNNIINDNININNKIDTKNIDINICPINIINKNKTIVNSNKRIIKVKKKIKVKRNFLKNNKLQTKNNIDIYKKYDENFSSTLKIPIKSRDTNRLRESNLDINSQNSKFTIYHSEKEKQDIDNIISDPNYNLDNYSFEKAILYDKRSFWRIYYICLLSKERTLHAFVLKSPLEIKSLRISLFLFNNASDFALNAFFYTNKNISDKYHNNGDNLLRFTLLNNLIISFSSILVSVILTMIFNLLIQSKRKIKNIFKKEKENENENSNGEINNDKHKNIMLEKLNKVYENLRIKIFCYILLEFLILLFFFYYITGFCIVYKETQINWLLDSILSIIISLFVKLFLSFLIAVFYLLSLKYKLKTLYCITMLIY